VGKEGRLFSPGSLIKVQHEGFKLGLGSGEIIGILKEGNFITGFQLMERFDIASDRDYFIEYYVVDENRNHVVHPEPEMIGMEEVKHRTLKLQSVGEYTNVLMLTTPIPADDFYTPEMFNILSVLYGEPTGIQGKIWEAKRYLVSDLSETSQGYDLTLVQYNEDVYKTTTIDEIPPYQSSILTAPPRIGITPDTRPYDGKGGKDGQTTRLRYASTSSLTSPAYTANADNPGSSWYETPPAITAS
jgi:hypothetical protein